MEPSSVCQDLKRKESCSDEENAISFKKAKYEWQIKRSGIDKKLQGSELLCNDADEISKVLDEGIDNKQGCNLRSTFDKNEHSYGVSESLDLSNDDIRNFSKSISEAELSCHKPVEQIHSKLQKNLHTDHNVESVNKVMHAGTYNNEQCALPIKEFSDSMEHCGHHSKNSNSGHSFGKKGACSQNYDQHAFATEMQSSSSSCELCNINRSSTHCNTTNNMVPSRLDELDVFLTRRQNHHVAKAVVDNAINKTLEEMGVSPEADTDGFTAEKSHIEDEGICEAIRSQGLIPQQQPEYQLHISPFISQLQQVSEIVFTGQQNNPRATTSLPLPLHIENSSEVNNLRVPSNSNREEACSLISSSTVPVSSNDLLHHAVSMAICSRGLSLQEEG